MSLNAASYKTACNKYFAMVVLIWKQILQLRYVQKQTKNCVSYPFPDTEPCEVTFALADAVAEEGITFARGPLGWGSCPLFRFKYL